MAVHLRLTRKGSKKNPFYRIVASDKGMPRDGRFLEIVGTYDPSKKTDPEKVTLKEERIGYWLDNGALPTVTVKSLLKKSGVFQRRIEKSRAEKSAVTATKEGRAAGA